VQLRTILQDAWAEVEHELIYKSDIKLPNASIRRKLAALTPRSPCPI
jgi:putative GTP pyrophosphokinase